MVFLMQMQMICYILPFNGQVVTLYLQVVPGRDRQVWS